MKQLTKLKSEDRELLQMLKHYNESFCQIAELMGYSRQAVMRHVNKLEELGYIQIDRTSTKKKILLKSITICEEV